MLHAVARLHYVGDLSQVEIARRFGVSTATISRMLRRARAEGIVRIDVRDLVQPDLLTEQLERRLGLRCVAVVEAPVASAPAALAAPLGEMLQGKGLGAGAVLMIGWGRTVRAILEAGLPALPGVDVVPATGGMQQEAAHFQINEFVRIAAGQVGGVPHFIHAPNLPQAEARESFLADPAIRRAVALWDRIDVAIVGIGLPPMQVPQEASVATEGEKSLPDAAGDVVRHYFDIDGRAISWRAEARLIAVTPAQLRAARLTVAVATGEGKVAGIVGAARAGLIGGLVTDVRTAEAVLDLAGPAPG